MKFAHPSEKTFSEHLDLFDIEWIYEPLSFPLEWGSGSIKKMFTPDFYLPTLNLFVEITTMNQNLITKKRKKLKIFFDRGDRELIGKVKGRPDISVSFMHAREILDQLSIGNLDIGISGLDLLKESEANVQKNVATSLLKASRAAMMASLG